MVVRLGKTMTRAMREMAVDHVWGVFWHALAFVAAGPFVGMLLSPFAPFIMFGLPLAYFMGWAPALITGVCVGAVGPLLPSRLFAYRLAAGMGAYAAAEWVVLNTRSDPGYFDQIIGLSGALAGLVRTFLAKRLMQATQKRW